MGFKIKNILVRVGTSFIGKSEVLSYGPTQNIYPPQKRQADRYDSSSTGQPESVVVAEGSRDPASLSDQVWDARTIGFSVEIFPRDKYLARKSQNICCTV